jgi:hypothetical protein
MDLRNEAPLAVGCGVRSDCPGYFSHPLYCLAILNGFVLPRGFLGHGGDFAGYATVMVYQPGSRATIVVIVNIDPVPGERGGAATALFDKLVGVLHGLRTVA